MALTYSQLVTQIRNYTEVDSNGLSDSTLNVIVQNAENRIYRELNIDAFRLYASAVTTAGTTTISVPSGLKYRQHYLVAVATRYCNDIFI